MNRETWRQATRLLSGGQWTLLGLWAEREQVHMAVDDNGGLGVLSFVCEDNRFPSVGQLHPPAIRLERAIRDLWGLEPEGLADTRPWLDHGRWRVPPSGDDGSKRSPVAGGYTFLPAEGESLHQIPVGPVHAGIIEPGHFRFTANGEAVVRLEARLGYVHKGIERLMEGAPLDRAVVLAGRVSGDSTVAYALAFARAIEAAHGIEVPRRAVWLRALMAELERLANHFGDIGAICNDAAFAMMHAQCGHLREQVLRVADKCFGHRLMMDQVVPGGVKRDLQSEDEKHVRSLLADIRKRFPELVELYDNTASLQDRTVGTGVLSAALGAAIRLRRLRRPRLWTKLRRETPPRLSAVRCTTVRRSGARRGRCGRPDLDPHSRSRAKRCVDRSDPARAPARARFTSPRGSCPRRNAREGMALVEGFRGDMLVWVRTGADGKIERCHLRDPSWFQWPLLEAAIEGNIVADFPLCNKSFNCSYSGHDL